jgi:hypothetical protein
VLYLYYSCILKGINSDMKKIIKNKAKNIGRNSFLILFLILSLILGAALANQGLDFDIIASFENFVETPTIFLMTLKNTSSGVDTFDQALPSVDKFDVILKSIIDSSDNFYIVDYWDAEKNSSRHLKLVFQIMSNINKTGLLNLSWNSSFLQDAGGRYSFILNDYGNDSTLSVLLNSLNMNDLSSYSVWNNNFSSRYFEIETDYKYCGDGICSAWESFFSCPLDCFSSGGGGSSPSPGPSPNPSQCVNECFLGDKRCSDSLNYQICGDFNNDGCLQWGYPKKCIGKNPFCLDGLCFGCVSDNDCLNGSCVSGKCELNCEKTCQDFGLQCGKVSLCGDVLDCGVCQDGYFCNSGECSRIPEDVSNIPETISSGRGSDLFEDSKDVCLPDYFCFEWSECKVSYNPLKLLSGEQWFSGKRSRECFDRNNCYSSLKENEDCRLKIEINIKEENICGARYLEIYDKSSNKLLAQTRGSRNQFSQIVEVFLLPNEIDCLEDFSQVQLSSWEKLMFSLDLRKTFKAFL